MSEYQYYEFLAIDRPLTAQEVDALMGLSTQNLGSGYGCPLN